ncbi:MAG: hypothetical protein ABI140_13755 [Jatrophihabitantaceae bacterium]
MSKQLVRAAVGTGTLIAGGLIALASATPAAATPTGCHLTQASHSASSVCTGGSGQQRVYAICEDPQHGTDRTYYGSWVGVGSTSVVNCPVLGGYTWYEVAAGIQVR